jgi:NAD(P)H-dependent flavin oxidoreductase YrpB (nitropropane dioxygenase family)
MTDQSAPRSGSPLHTPICDLLGITHPIVLGGMGTGTSPELVSAVSNAGGLGTIGMSGRRPDDVAGIIAAIRAQTSAPFGVNFLLFAVNDAALTAALAEKPRVVSFAWAWSDQDLKPYIDRAHAAGALVTYMVSGVPDARRAAEAGTDVIVAQGSEGGGHVGTMGTLPLVPMVVDAVGPVPVLAAGGIADGRGLAASLALGADGVLIGTKFLATNESPLSPNSKAAIIASDGHDTVLTEIPDIANSSTWPGAFSRVRRNAFVAEWAGRENELRRQRGEVARAILTARAADDAEHLPLFFGQDAGLIDEILPAGEVVRRMADQAAEIVRSRFGRFLDVRVPVL